MEKNVGARLHDDESGLDELFGVLWAGKFLIGAITASFTLGSIIVALLLPNQYQATTLLAPAQSDGGGLSSALGQLGGLASLAGVSIGDGSSSESQIAQEVMKSWSFVESFIADNDLAVEVYAATGWSKTSGTLIFDEDVYRTSDKTWRLEDSDTGELRPPTSWELFQRFSEMLSVSQDQQTGLVSVSIEYYSPDLAKEWLDLYVTAINQHMQLRQVAKVSNNIRYLEDQIAKTSIAEMREVFYTIIEEQTKNKMVAEASPDYVFVSVSPSMIPEEKSQPSRALICVLGTFAGLFIGAFSVVARFIFLQRQT